MGRPSRSRCSTSPAHRPSRPPAPAGRRAAGGRCPGSRAATRSQVSQVHRAVVGRPAFRLPGQRRGSGAVAERVDQIGHRAGRAHDVDRPIGAEAYVVAVDQHRDVRRGQAEPARQRVRRDVHLEQPARRVVLQPLPHVALVRAGPHGELARGSRDRPRAAPGTARAVRPGRWCRARAPQRRRGRGDRRGPRSDRSWPRRCHAAAQREPRGAGRDEHSGPTLPPRDDAAVLPWGSSYKGAAERLNLHHNSVKYRSCATYRPTVRSLDRRRQD